MKIKIKLQTEDPYDFELDIFESFCTVPMIIDNNMTMGFFVAGIDLSETTFEYIHEKLKEILKEKNTKSFYVKKFIFTVTGLTAYSINIGNKISAGRIFEGFDENIRIYEITPVCIFPYEGTTMYFQTKGEMFIEFDLEDIFFVNSDFQVFHDFQNDEREIIKKINNENPYSYLQEISSKQFTFKIDLEESSYYKK